MENEILKKKKIGFKDFGIFMKILFITNIITFVTMIILFIFAMVV